MPGGAKYMGLTDREKELLVEIQLWQDHQFLEFTNDFVNTFDRWLDDTFLRLPEDFRHKFFKQLDQWLFTIQAVIQQSENQTEKMKKLLTEASIENQHIHTITDLKQLPIEQLNYFANREKSNHQLISLLQGGVSGSGSSLLLGMDIPLMITVNLRAIQNIACSYGYDVRNPFEMMIALKLFHAATLPRRFQKHAWDKLMAEVKDKHDPYFYEGDEKITAEKWMLQLLTQILKAWAILLFRKKKKEGVSFISLAIGAGLNYQMTKKVTEFAQRFYQNRLLLEKSQSK